MFGKFSEDAQKILVLAKGEKNDLKQEYIGSEHIILAMLKNDIDIIDKFKKYKITYKKYKDKLIDVVGIGSSDNNLILYTTIVKRIMENLILDSKETGEEITSISLLLAILNEGEGTGIRILLSLGVDINKLYLDISDKRNIKTKKTKKLTIEELSVDLTKKAKNNEIDPVINREDEINRVIEILSRKTKNNPILIGSAGVGKTAIVEGLAERIVKKDVPSTLLNKKILSLDMASSVAGTKYRGEFEERIKKIIKELEENEDIIVFIDEIHTLVGAGGAEGAIDASNIFKPALARGKIKVIGATTIEEYKKTIEKDNALDRRFQKIIIEEPDKDKLKDILMSLKPIYENYHNVKIDENIIDKIIELSERYIYDRFEPDRSIDILDEVCTKVSLKEENEEVKIIKLTKILDQIKEDKKNSIINQNYDKAYILKEKEKNITDKINRIKLKLLKKKKYKKVKIEDVYNLISIKTKIPISEINDNINNQVKKIENDLRKNIIGQDSAIDELIEITKKLKLGIKDKNKSYSLLFCGPTGVGKTYLAKVFAKNLVGENNIIKLDMSEYSEGISINKLIGSPAGYIGYDDNKNILDKVRSKPYSVLILDEIEKAHKSVINFFLNILDEGSCMDSMGRKIRFDNVIIIMTSNSYTKKELMGFNNNIKTNALEDFFSKEFINRIDEIIMFNKFTKQNINKIILKEIDNCYKKYGKDSILSLDMIDSIINESDYEIYGARKLCKIIRKKIEKEIINKVFL